MDIIIEDVKENLDRMLNAVPLFIIKSVLGCLGESSTKMDEL